MVNYALSRVIDIFSAYEITEVVLPFLLIFTILFAILQQVKIFGDGKKNLNTGLALLIALIAVIPHYTGRYPGNYDPVVIINALIPSAAVLAIAILLVLILMGIWGAKINEGVPMIAIIIILGVLLFVFGTTVGWWDTPLFAGYWWDDDLVVLVVVILVFGLIIKLITGEENSTGIKDIFSALTKRQK